MGWSGGVYTQTDGTYSGDGICASQAGDGDAAIKSSEMDALLEDHADGINACLNKDGSNAATGNLDLGNNKITNLANGTASGNAGTWNKDVASVSLDGTTLEVNFNDATQVTVDLASVGSAGEVTLTDAQTISGSKTMTGTTTMTTAKFNGVTHHKVSKLTSGASVAIDVTSNNRFYLSNDQAMTLNFTLPTTASDSDLGDHWYTSGSVFVRNTTGHGALTISATADDTETIGSRGDGATELYELVYSILVIDGATKYAKFTWVSP